MLSKAADPSEKIAGKLGGKVWDLFWAKMNRLSVYSYLTRCTHGNTRSVKGFTELVQYIL